MDLRRIEEERRREKGRRRMEEGGWKKMNERKDEGHERRKVEVSMRKESLRNRLFVHCTQ